MNSEPTQVALDAERAARPDWSTVARYTEQAVATMLEVQRCGYEVVEHVNGFEVRYGGINVAAEGTFAWGWVADTDGRTEYRVFTDYLGRLSAEAVSL